VHRLPEQLWKKLAEEYNKEMAGGSIAGVRDRSRDGALPDPYKAAMYVLIGRFKPHRDVDLFRLVCPTTEDYMWLKVISHHSDYSFTHTSHTLAITYICMFTTVMYCMGK
jgi:hypothetical protein